MSNIMISPHEFNDELDKIKEAKSYIELPQMPTSGVKSTLTSVVSQFDVMERKLLALEKYLTFLERDVVKCKQDGQVFFELDGQMSKSFDEILSN